MYTTRYNIVTNKNEINWTFLVAIVIYIYIEGERETKPTICRIM